MKNKMIGIGGLVKSVAAFACVCLAVFLSGCKGDAGSLRSGDLLFQVNGGSFADAITDATGVGGDGLPYSHVGIVKKCPEGLFVVEATPSGGVRCVELSVFLNESARSVSGEALVTVARIADERCAKEAVARAEKEIGKPYDFSFLPDNDALYCSELVYECFLDRDGNHIFSTAPMSLCDSSGKTIPYWAEYFAKRGEPVPEGVAGTNPNDMSKDPHLRYVMRFFSE